MASTLAWRAMLRSGVLGAVAAFVYLAPACGSDSSDPVPLTGAAGAASGSGVAGHAGSGGAASSSSSSMGSGGTSAGTAGSAGGGGAGGIGADASDTGTAGSGGGSADARADIGSDAPKDGPGDAAVRVGLKVATFNIRYANPADGVNAWPNRRDMWYRVVRAMDADTLGLQEVLFTQVGDIAAALPEFQRIGVGRDDGKEAGEFSEILYRAARFDVAESGTFWFSDTPDVPGSSSWGNASIRICTWGRFVEKGTGRSFYQFNVHLDNVSQPANEKSVVLLMQRVVARKVTTDPFIVTGDFNSGETQLAVRYMSGAATIAGMANPIPLVDSFRQLYPTATGVSTFHNFLGGTAGDKIDFIFMGPGEKALAAEIVHTSENGRYPSDHYPVTATIDILAWR